MTTLREAAQQALEALESDPVALNAINNACAFLRAALAEPVQEPVAGNTLLKEFLAFAKEAGVTHLRPAEPVLERCNYKCEAWPECACAEPEQEPVAWSHNLIAGNVITHRPADIDRHPDRWTALYPAPQPCPTCEALARTVMLDQTSHDTAPPQRKPLMDAEIDNLPWNGSPRQFARAIERAHGIGGQDESA